ncbi:MAG: hypothetical protein R3B99_17355 [Polyangiales bacterium]
MRETTASSLKESIAFATAGTAPPKVACYAYAPRFILSCSEALMREVGEATQWRSARAQRANADERAA